MPRAPRATMPVYAGDDDSQREASTLWGGITVYTDDRLLPGYIRVGTDDPQHFALHPSGVIPVSREMAYGEDAPASPMARGGRVQMEWMDEATYDQTHNPFDEIMTVENMANDGTVTVRRRRGTTGDVPMRVREMPTYDERTDTPLLSAINWYDTPIRAELRSTPDQPADHRHEWAVTAMHMDGGVRFDLGCAHCDRVYRGVHRDRMEQLIDSNTDPASSRPEPSRPATFDAGDRHWVETEAIIGGHRFPTERWNEGGYERTLFRVEGFRQDGERVSAQSTLTFSTHAGRDPVQTEAYRQRVIAQLFDECERAGMIRDERVTVSSQPY